MGQLNINRARIERLILRGRDSAAIRTRLLNVYISSRKSKITYSYDLSTRTYVCLHASGVSVHLFAAIGNTLLINQRWANEARLINSSISISLV